jgi:hypothetical protein
MRAAARTCIKVAQHESCLVGLAHRLVCEVDAGVAPYDSLQHLRASDTGQQRETLTAWLNLHKAQDIVWPDVTRQWRADAAS